MIDNGGPSLEVLSPKRATDPVKDEVMVGNEVVVRCQVTKRSNANTVDTQSIYGEIYLAGKDTPEISAPALATDTRDVYEAKVTLTEIPHGGVYAACRAADVKGRDNVLGVPTFYDAGPTIEVMAPADDHYLRATRIPVVIKVGLARLGSSDSEAGVAEIVALSNGEAFTLVARDGAPGIYEGEINLTDAVSPPPSLAFTFRATNKRTPTAAVRQVAVTSPVDAKAPIATVDDPKPSTIVGNRLTIRATVSDPDIIEGVPGSGVDRATVRAVVTGNGPSEEFDMTSVSANEFEAVVPTLERFTNAGSTQIRVNVYARDQAGNESDPGSAGGSTVYPDTVPPYISLDPPIVREVIVKSNKRICSVPYDPLGLAANDLTVTTSLPRPLLRIFAWDRALAAPTIRFAHVDPATVELHLQSDPNTPMLVAGNDGKCDPTRIQSSSLVKFAPLTSTEAQKIGLEGPDGDLSAEPAVDGQCGGDEDGYATTLNDQLCDKQSDMTRVLRHGAPPFPSAVYGYPELSGAACTGDYTELDSAPGWKCVVARAADSVGNESVSAPLRICYDDGSGACDGDPPSCTDGCVLDELYTEGESTDTSIIGLWRVISH